MAAKIDPEFELTAGDVCLDFINTLDDRFSEMPKELLTDHSDLARFGQQSGVLTGREADSLIKRAHAAPEQARAALRKAIKLREAMHAVFQAIVEGRKVGTAELGELNRYIQEAAGHAELEPANGRFESRFDYGASLDSVRWAIARAAGELLTSSKLAFVRTCDSPTCRWFFLDTSKNHQRRWCDMKQCGNREKARRFYERKREG